MLKPRVLSYRDLEAFLARGEETDSPVLSRSPLSAKEITEHWQAVWRNRLPYTGHCAHHQDNGDGDPPSSFDTTGETALDVTLASYDGTDDIIAPQAHHDEPPTRQFTRARRVAYGVIATIAMWCTFRALRSQQAPGLANVGGNDDCDVNLPAGDDADNTFEIEDDADDHAEQRQVLKRDEWISRAPHRRDNWRR